MEKLEMDTSNNDCRRRRKGGLKTMPFIIANEAFEKIASYGLQPNMILYLITAYQYSVASATSTLFIWGAISNFMPIFGAFVSDSYLGRFLVISLATLITLIGLVALWLTAIIEKSHSPECDIKHIGDHGTCHNPKPVQYVLLFAAFVLMSIGAGGIRPCSIAFGADQFDKPGKSPNYNARIMQSFFNWYYASLGISLMIAVTVIVYIQNEFGWVIGFGVPVGLMLLSAFMFFVGSKLYVQVKPDKSLLTGLVQVLVASWKKRRLPFPDHDPSHYYQSNGSGLLAPTHKLRYLNKACILSNPEEELDPEGSPRDPWSLCSVTQVQVMKSLLQLVPVWSTGIMIGVTISQNSFPVLQANTLNRKLAGNFKIPAGSFGIFGILSLTIWVMLYDRVMVPHLSKYTKNPRGLGVQTRIGIGIFISCLATATAALVERSRRGKALHQGLAETPKAQVDMSAMWLIPQHCLTGLGEAFNAIGQIELYYSVFPRGMASIAVALFALGMAVANLVGSLIVNVVDVASSSGGGQSWVSTNLNKGHYDYYYWLLSLLSMFNFVYFIFCSRAFKLCQEDKLVSDEDVVVEEEADKTAPMEVAMVDHPHISNSKDDSSSTYFSA